MPDFEWVTITGAVRILGISEDTIRRRIKAGSMQHRFDNRGRINVLVPTQSHTQPPQDHTQEEPKTAQHLTQELTQDHTQEAQPHTQGLVSLDDVRRLLGEITSQHETAIAAIRAGHEAAVGLLVERIDAAEVRAERAEEKISAMLDRLMLPWWRRWFG